MKALHWIIAAAALACTESVLAEVNDPEVLIYRFPGDKRICTAMTIDAGASKPVGVALRGIRFSPVPGSQE